MRDMTYTGAMKTPGRTMAYWLAQAAKQARLAADKKPYELSALLHRDPSTITRFEQGRTLPPEIDRYLAAYAQLCGLEDNRALWTTALELWYEHGLPMPVDPE